MGSKRIALLLFGGTGTRFGGDTPKQFQLIDGKPLMCYTVEKFDQSEDIDMIYVVVPENYVNDTVQLLMPKYKKVATVSKGGSTRQESVFKSLCTMRDEHIAEDDDIILVHDGDRPNVSKRIIHDNVVSVMKTGAVLTAIPSYDSLYSVDEGKINGTLDRSKVYRAQTPQTFFFKDLCDAHIDAHKKHREYSDDASIFVQMGKEVAIVMGEESNLKITLREDLRHIIKE